MKRVVLVMLAVWALILSPSLCRAGVLTECCVPQRTETTDCQPGGCCGEQEPTDADCPPDDECAVCGDVCDARINPLKRSASADPGDHAIEWAGSLHGGVAPIPPRPCVCPANTCRSPNLPYPPSDVPMLA